MDANNEQRRHVARREDERVVKELLANVPGSVDVNEKDEDGKSALHRAAENNFLDVVRNLLGAENIDANAKDKGGKTALHWAATDGHVAVVRLLLGADNIDVNAKDKGGKTALHWAASDGHVAVVRLLLGADNIDVNAKNRSLETPLHEAVYHNLSGIVKELLGAANIDVNAYNGAGQTALHLVVTGLQVDTLIHLLRADNVNVNARDGKGQTALHLTATTRYREYATPSEREKRVTIVRKLLAVANVDVNVTDAKGKTALHLAVTDNPPYQVPYLEYVDVVRELLSAAKIDVNGRDAEGTTALQLAAGTIRVAMMEQLLAHDANIEEVEYLNTQDPYGWGILHWAILNGHFKLVKNLLAVNHVDVNLRTRSGCTPLHLAVLVADSKITSLLVSNPNVIFAQADGEGKIPIEMAHTLANATKEERVELLKNRSDEILSDTLQTLGVPERRLYGIVKNILENSTEGKNYLENLWLKDRQVNVDAANAILVGAALIASVTFASWLQPPLNYTESNYVPSSYPSDSPPKYADVGDNVGLGVFWIFNSLSFYFAIGTVVLGACSVLPGREMFIKDEVRRLRRNLLVTSFLLALSVFCVLIAFGTAGFIVLAPRLRYRWYMIGPTILGGLVCGICLMYFVKNILEVIWSRKQILHYRSIKSHSNEDFDG